jgi:ferredoxin
VVTGAAGGLDPLRSIAMKIHINKARCVGHARCATVAPEIYSLNDDGYIAVEEIEVVPGQEALARRGARACPERIITVEETEFRPVDKQEA